MTDRVLVIVVDADAIIAQAFPQDNLHDKAMKIAEKLVRLNAKVLYPVTAITEAVTHIQRVLSSSATAYDVATAFTGSNVDVVEVNHETVKRATQVFSPDVSKKNTLYDCIVASIAKEYGADAIFSFDRFYKKQEFKLASEIFS